MTGHSWIDHLEPGLRRMLGDKPWLRLEHHRDGYWMGLRPAGEENEPAWFLLDADRFQDVPLRPFQDEHLKGIMPAVSKALYAGLHVQLLSHKPGRRAILLAEGEGTRHILKVYRKNRMVHQRWTSLPPSRDGALRTPKVLEWDEKLRTLSLELCPGTPLHDLWRGRGREAADGTLVTEVLRWLREQPVDRALPEHFVEQEIALLESRLGEFQQVLAEAPSLAAELVPRVCAALEAGRGEAVVYAHRDLHDKQILRHEQGGFLIDLDLVARAPAALDVGNILAHLHLRTLQGMGGDPLAVATPILEDAREAGLADALPRWTAATLTRLALLYCRRTHPEGLIERLLESADQALTAGDDLVDLFRTEGTDPQP